MARKMNVINSRPMETPGIEGVSIDKVLKWHEKGILNLSPDFQRKSVWKLPQRSKLMNTILRQFPIPTIVLYKRKNPNTGAVVYDVIDGKQRLETVLLYLGLIRGNDFRFAAKFSNFVEDVENTVSCTWKELDEQNQRQILQYDIPVIFVEGGLTEIREVFVRLNSTGKALTRQEVLNAKYVTSPLLKEMSRFAKKMDGILVKMEVVSATDIERMRDVEFLTELTLSVLRNDVLDKKKAIDDAMTPGGVDGRKIPNAVKRVAQAINYIHRMLPNISSTRLKKAADFYTLVTVFDKLSQEGAALQNVGSRQLAGALLTEFANQVDFASKSIKDFNRKAELNTHALNYALSVKEGGDSASHRRDRQKLILDLLKDVYVEKDCHRIFNDIQRRIIWNSTKNHKCCNPKCRKPLRWPDFEVDHVKPHSKGGRTDLENAALICKSCNASKGNRDVVEPRTKRGQTFIASSGSDGRDVSGIPYKVSEVVRACIPEVFKRHKVGREEFDYLLSKKSSRQFKTGGWPVLKKNRGRDNDRYSTLSSGRKSARYYAAEDVEIRFRGERCYLTSQFAPHALASVVEWLGSKGISKKEVSKIVKSR